MRQTIMLSFDSLTKRTSLHCNLLKLRNECTQLLLIPVVTHTLNEVQLAVLISMG